MTPSQSSSSLLQVSGTGCTVAVHCGVPFWHWNAPVAQAPFNPVLHGAPTPGTPSSTLPLQSSSTPSQVVSLSCGGKYGQRYSQPGMLGSKSLYPGSHSPTPHFPFVQIGVAWSATQTWPQA